MVDYSNLTPRQKERVDKLNQQTKKQKEYRQTHRTQYNERSRRRYAEAHPKPQPPGRPRLPKEELRTRRTVYHHKYIQEHKDEHKERCNRYYSKYPNVTKNSSLRYRARLFNSEGTFTFEEFKDMCKRQKYVCTYCGKPTKTLVPDHMTPISKGGTNNISNITPACVSCNAGKRNKTSTDYVEWRRRIGLPVREDSIE